MTTQTITVSLLGAEKGRKFEITATDATWNSLTTLTGTNLLKDALKNVLIRQYQGEFAAAIGVVRIRDTNTNIVKEYLMLDQLGESYIRPVRRPFTVGPNDVAEVYCDVA